MSVKNLPNYASATSTEAAHSPGPEYTGSTSFTTPGVEFGAALQ